MNILVLSGPTSPFDRAIFPALVLLLVSLSVGGCNSEAFDVSRVEPRLLVLAKPYRQVCTSLFSDGGTIGIVIVDRNGRQERFSLPAHLGEPSPYARVFVGVTHDRQPGAQLVEHSADTKNRLIQVLREAPNRLPGDDYCLALLTGRPSDYAHLIIHRVLAPADR